MIDVHSITRATRYRNVTGQTMAYNSDLPTPITFEVIDNPLLRINLSFSSYTVLEVWRVGVSVSPEKYETEMRTSHFSICRYR